jgi:hypothetical protein
MWQEAGRKVPEQLRGLQQQQERQAMLQSPPVAQLDAADSVATTARNAAEQVEALRAFRAYVYAETAEPGAGLGVVPPAVVRVAWVAADEQVAQLLVAIRPLAG